MRWINRKIINKTTKLPWLEIYPGKNTVERKSEFETFISEQTSESGNELKTDLKASLDEVLSMYEHSISYVENNGSLPKENHTQSELEEIDKITRAFSPLSHIHPVAEIKPDSRKNIVNYHYSIFNANDIHQNDDSTTKPSNYSLTNSRANNTYITETKAGNDDDRYAVSKKLHIGMEDKETKYPENKSVNDSILFGNDLSKYSFSSNVYNDNAKPQNPIENQADEDLFDITISRQCLIPEDEEFLLNPIIAECYYPAEPVETNEILESNEQTGYDDADIEDDELGDETESENNFPDSIPATEESGAPFRCSVTPEIKTSNQFHIPFNVLRTGSDEYDHSDPVEVQQIIEKLESTLDQFGIEARVIGMQRGPIITRYEIRIPPGIKVNRILSLTDELAMALEALRVRIEAPIPGRSTVGIEIPNKKRSTVLLGDILNHPEYTTNAVRLPLPLGKDIAGNLLIEDLSRMPHILIAGATGSGKSVAINSFITSMIITRSPEEVRMLMVDPKLVELSQYNDIPHLLHPVISDAPKAILALNWAVEEMDRRYEDMADMRARDIISYNQKVDQHNKIKRKNEDSTPKMPYIVILIDELGDLMMVAGKEVESSIIRLSQKARAIGIHLILATQRPSVDVITALIKANCPARIALQVAQKTDSRTILDSNGGEQLLGQGDMLFKHPSRAQLIRAQAPYVSDQEVENVVNMVKKFGKPSYIILEDPKAKTGELEMEDENLFDEAWSIIVESNKASASYLQRRLRIGYNRAARIIEAFEARGYIGPQVGSKPREIYIHNS